MPEQKRNFLNQPGSLFHDAYRWLIQPSNSVSGVEDRLKAELLSSLILLLILLLVVSRLAGMASTPESAFVLTDAVGIALLVAAYGFSRSKWFKVGAWLVIFPIPVLVLISLLIANSIESQYNMMYLIISLILVSIFFKVRGIITFTLITVGMIYSLPQFMSEPLLTVEATNRSLTAFLLSAALLTVFVLVRNQVEGERLKEFSSAYDATIQGWARALELRDKETLGHSKRVTALSLRLAERVGVKQENMEHIRRGALLHDIGKMSIPDTILTKVGPLTGEDWVILKRHPEIGYELLKSIEHLQPALDIPLYHHEKWDGSGYPYGLEGREIPLAARIFAIVDVWDSLLSERPFREAWPRQIAVAYMEEQAGKHFDPDILVHFLEMISAYK